MTREVSITAKERISEGYLKVERYRLHHERFAGGMMPELQREVMVRGKVVAVLPYDPRTDRVVLIEQFRIGAYRAERPAWQIEIVAGVVEPDETPENVARRETEEEVGVGLSRIHPIGQSLVSPGCSDEDMALFCGEIDSRGVGGIHGLAGEGEDIRAFSLPWNEALTLLNEGRLTNFPIVLAMQWLALNREALRGRWSVESSRPQG